METEAANRYMIDTNLEESIRLVTRDRSQDRDVVVVPVTGGGPFQWRGTPVP